MYYWLQMKPVETNQNTQSIIQFIYTPIKVTKKLQRTIVGCHAESPARPSLMSTQFYPTAHSSLKSGQQSKEPGNYSAAACVTFFVYFLNVQKSFLKSFPRVRGLLFSLRGKETRRKQHAQFQLCSILINSVPIVSL